MRVDRNNREDLNPSRQNEFRPGFSVADYIDLATQILEKHIKADSGVTDFEVVAVKKTSKSIYGEVRINNERRYFKISSSENIGNELMGYRLACDLPHKDVIGHHFDDEGVYGLYLQDYCEELDDGGLLLCALNRDLLTEDDGRIEEIRKQSETIFRPMGLLFQRSLTEEPCMMVGVNDRFFADRLASGARFDEIYSGKDFEFSSIDEVIAANELFNCEFTVNGGRPVKSVNSLIEEARVNLDPKKSRVFVMSQGDMLESNVTVEGTYFDFETGGLNSLTQEMSIFLCGLYFGGHYIFAKYSPLDSSYRTEQVNEFEGRVDAGCQLNRENKKFDIFLDFPFPKVKKAVLDNYISQVVEPLEQRFPEELLADLIEELKSAILARVLAVKNITAFDEKDRIFILGMVAHFFEDSRKYKRMSDFIRDKFKSISK